MNKFPLEIDGKEYVFTVNRRTNVLAKTPQERLAKLLDFGVSMDTLTKLMSAADDKELAALMKEHNVSAEALISLNDTSVSDYEDMFYRCLAVEHPMSREEATALLDKAEEEYGWDYLIEAIEVMSAQGFTSNAAENKKQILWLEQNKKSTVPNLRRRSQES